MKTFLLILCFSCAAYGEISLQNLNIPNVDIDDFSAIREKCDKLGGNGTYENLKASKAALQACVQGFVDVSVLKIEVEEAKKTGSMDEVFGKYCQKRPKLASCIESFTDSLRPCLSGEEKKALNVTLDILKQLGEFVCFRDGDRIAMFIAEGGVECIKAHTEGIQNCVNSTFKISPAVNTNALPNLLMDKKKCDDLGTLQTCVVEELEKCKDSTPANVIDALFRFIKRSACSNKNKRSVAFPRFVRSLSIAERLYSTDQKTSLISHIKVKCEQNVGEKGYKAFTKALQDSSLCLVENQSIANEPVDEIKENFRNCVKGLIETTRKCLPSHEQYFPELLYSILSNLIDFVYRNRDLLTRAPQPELINCLQKFKQQSTRNEISNCIKHQDNDLRKEVICGGFIETQSCLSQLIKKNCIRDIKISKFADELFEAVTQPCTQF